MTDRPEKKSERFEVRLPHSKKQDFVKACEDQGDTPSSAVRRFIDSYVRRSDADTMGMAIRALPKLAMRRWRHILGILAAGGFGIVCLYMVISFVSLFLTKTELQRLFVAYDKNSNQVLEIGEISEADEHLHRILNVDGVEGISLEEFWLEGKITWKFVNPDTFQIVEQSDGLLTHSSQTKNVSSPDGTGNLDYSTQIVEFDLTDSKTPKIATWKQGIQTSTSPATKNNGSVYWVKGQTRPIHVMGTNRDVFLKTTP